MVWDILFIILFNLRLKGGGHSCRLRPEAAGGGSRNERSEWASQPQWCCCDVITTTVGKASERAERVSELSLWKCSGRAKRAPHERTSAAGERVNLIGATAVPILNVRASERSERVSPGGRADHFRHSWNLLPAIFFSAEKGGRGGFAVQGAISSSGWNECFIKELFAWLVSKYYYKWCGIHDGHIGHNRLRISTLILIPCIGKRSDKISNSTNTEIDELTNF
jgi:hypothetical protein